MSELELNSARKSPITASNEVLERINRKIDQITEDNMKPRDGVERFFPTRIQRAVLNSTAQMIQTRSNAQIDGMKLVQQTQLKYLQNELENAVSLRLCDMKESGMSHLSDKKRQFAVALRESGQKYFEDLDQSLKRAESISNEQLRNKWIEIIIEDAFSYSELIAMQCEVLDRLIKEYSNSSTY
jgi:hypothetical protein